jgi:formylglycine-generating enzyme required for sulfatase activity
VTLKKIISGSRVFLRSVSIDLPQWTDIIKRMKKWFFLKLAIAILAGFGLLFAGFVFWKPLNVTYYKYRIGSDNIEAHKAAVKYLLEADAIVPVSEYYSVRYGSKNVKERLAVVNELCEFGDKGKALMREIFRKRCMREQILIPAGSFMMGGGDEIWRSRAEKPKHQVTLREFWMDRYEVTNEKYYVFTKVTGHYAPDYEFLITPGKENHPVDGVSWEDANNYAKWVGMRLPTEAEWEYACRAGSTTEYCFGDDVNELGDYAWFDFNCNAIILYTTHPVGRKKPNKLGMYDMHGNVDEWCADWFDVRYYTNSPTDNPKGPDSGELRVFRGGNWEQGGIVCRSAFRGGLDPAYYFGGIRVCRSSGR